MAEITDPVVWRRIHVPFDYTFDQLHHLIQAAFGWKNSHLYMFSENGFGDLISINSPYDEEGAISAKNVPVNNILIELLNNRLMGGKEKKLKYIYDFGDSWEHEIVVEDLDRSAAGKPELIDGAGACPPEDCGGIPGFMDIKKELAGGGVSEFRGESWLPWLEDMGYADYNPLVFDVEAARRRMKRVG